MFELKIIMLAYKDINVHKYLYESGNGKFRPDILQYNESHLQNKNSIRFNHHYWHMIYLKFEVDISSFCYIST